MSLLFSLPFVVLAVTLLLHFALPRRFILMLRSLILEVLLLLALALALQFLPSDRPILMNLPIARTLAVAAPRCHDSLGLPIRLRPAQRLLVDDLVVVFPDHHVLHHVLVMLFVDDHLLLERRVMASRI